MRGAWAGGVRDMGGVAGRAARWGVLIRGVGAPSAAKGRFGDGRVWQNDANNAQTRLARESQAQLLAASLACAEDRWKIHPCLWSELCPM